MEDLGLRKWIKMNNLIRLNFNYMGKNVEALLNLTDGIANALTIKEGSSVEEFARIEKYLEDEGFFDFYEIRNIWETNNTTTNQFR